LEHSGTEEKGNKKGRKREKRLKEALPAGTRTSHDLFIDRLVLRARERYFQKLLGKKKERGVRDKDYRNCKSSDKYPGCVQPTGKITSKRHPQRTQETLSKKKKTEEKS